MRNYQSCVSRTSSASQLLLMLSIILLMTANLIGYKSYYWSSLVTAAGAIITTAAKSQAGVEEGKHTSSSVASTMKPLAFWALCHTMSMMPPGCV